MTNATAQIIRNLGQRVISFHPNFVMLAGSVSGAVWLSQLLHWSDKGSDKEGWIYKTQADWEVETHLTRREQESARSYLKKNGILEEKLKGIPATTNYRLNFDVLAEALSNLTPAKPAKAAKAAKDKAKTTTVDEQTGVILLSDEDRTMLTSMVKKHGIERIKKIVEDLMGDGVRPLISSVSRVLKGSVENQKGRGSKMSTGKHSGFEQKNYFEGIDKDGSF